MALSLISFRAAGTPADTEVAIVVNSSNPVNSLTLAELRKIYFGDRQYWKGNLPVVLLMRSQGSHERDVVLRVVFEMTEDRYTKYWVAKVMRAEVSDPPASLYSFGMLQEGVRGNPGAIGYVNANDLRPGVKVLRIDGLLPGESGYSLR
jgi:phosphate transport system substrate-binding protein